MSKGLKHHPACVDCKHHQAVSVGTREEHFCNLPVWDLVLGRFVPAQRHCYDMRVHFTQNSECGTIGHKFEPKDE